VNGRVADDALSNFVASGLELRLDESDQIEARLHDRGDDGKDAGE
jgi:hypothetical protein